MTEESALDLGVRFGVSQSGLFSGTLEAANATAKGTPLPELPLGQRLNLDLGALPLEAKPVSVGLALASLGSRSLLDLELSALESEGRAMILASPRLMTLDQQTAVIESGEDIPYQESTLSGATSVAFKKAVLSLRVTPKITPEGQLLLAVVMNEDSDSGKRVQGVPILVTKALETKVLVKNGETIVLGGIYKHDKNHAVAAVPVLGSLPWLGALFRRKQIRARHEELLIFITPRIIVHSKVQSI